MDCARRDLHAQFDLIELVAKHQLTPAANMKKAGLKKVGFVLIISCNRFWSTFTYSSGIISNNINTTSEPSSPQLACGQSE
jgi:hypothetical protein